MHKYKYMVQTTSFKNVFYLFKNMGLQL